MNDRLTLKLVAGFLIAVCSAHLSLADGIGGSPPVSGMRQHAVPLRNFVQLQANAKKVDVDKLLGRAGEHQFTYMDQDGHVWQCEEFVFAEDPTHAATAFHLLYKDDALNAIVNSEDAWWHYKALIGVGRGEIEDRDKQKARLRRTPVQQFDDDTQIVEFFRVKSLRGDDIGESMPELKKGILLAERESKERDQRNPPDLGLTVAVAVIKAFTPADQAEWQRAYKVNANCIKKYDGGKVKIGMTELQVKQLLGPPLLEEELEEGQHAIIYGPRDTTEIAKVEAYLMCAPVLVLYQNGEAVRVLSNSFFSSDWRDRIWPELKSPERGSRPD
jgi:hypothetical protein